MLGQQNSSLDPVKQSSIASSPKPAVGNLQLEKAKSLQQPPPAHQASNLLALKQQPSQTNVAGQKAPAKSEALLQSEQNQKQAKLWLVLYLLKKFGIPKVYFEDAQAKKLDHSDPKFIASQQELLFTLVKQVLRSNPLKPEASLVRKLAVKVVLGLSVSSEGTDQSTPLNITAMLLQDQDFHVREVYLGLMRDLLPRFYAKNMKHFDSICTQEQVLSEKNFYVKKLILELMVQRCIYLAKVSEGGASTASQQVPQTSISSNDAANDMVRVLCTEIRAMHKDMRIFCAGLLTQIDQCVPTQTVIQMMQKESMFEQKFVQIGSSSSTNFAGGNNAASSASNQKASSALKAKPAASGSAGAAQATGSTGANATASNSQEQSQSKQGAAPAQSQPIELAPSVTGILLLMLEDDSMAVRLAGIRAMSCFGRVCSDIRSKCLNSLIDMLNDEINEVRIAALHGIQRFNKVLTLNDYEVEIVLFNLNEDNPRLREEIYLFFGETTVSQGALFTKILDKLFSNLVKFEHQEDTFKIFSLVQKLGKSHSKLVSSIYLKTLQIDKRYLAKEPDQTDIVYVAKMILIYAAAEQMPRILEEAPSFFGKHLNYLKDKYPTYFTHQKDSQQLSLKDSLSSGSAVSG